MPPFQSIISLEVTSIQTLIPKVNFIYPRASFKWEHTAYSPSVCLSFGVICETQAHSCLYQEFVPCRCCVVFHCMGVSSVISPLSSRWTFELFSVFGCDVHFCTHPWRSLAFISLG